VSGSGDSGLPPLVDYAALTFAKITTPVKSATVPNCENEVCFIEGFHLKPRVFGMTFIINRQQETKDKFTKVIAYELP